MTIPNMQIKTSFYRCLMLPTDSLILMIDVYKRQELWEYIQYLPDQIANNQFYVPWMTSQYEKALAENYRRILKHGRTSNIKKLNHTKKS